MLVGTGGAILVIHGPLVWSLEHGKLDGLEASAILEQVVLFDGGFEVCGGFFGVLPRL